MFPKQTGSQTILLTQEAEYQVTGIDNLVAQSLGFLVGKSKNVLRLSTQRDISALGNSRKTGRLKLLDPPWNGLQRARGKFAQKQFIFPQKTQQQVLGLDVS